jgi:oligoendopeptidase F
MSAVASADTPQVRWDLSHLYFGVDDPAVEQTWNSLMQRADAFAAKYRGTINAANLSAAHLAEAIRELESISQEVAKPYTYAELLFAGDTSNPAHGAFLQKQMEKGTELSVKLMFFELELQAAPAETIDQIVADPSLATYKHYIDHTRILSPHRLTEPEEIILEETANTGTRAWVRLFDEVTSNHVYKYKAPGSDEVQEMSQEEVLTLFRDPNREVRQAAADAFSAGLKELRRVIVFTYNNLLADKKTGDRLRKHPYPEHSRHLSNELDKETVDLVIRLCRQNYGLVERFYNVKREILGLPELTHVDRYAPLHEATEEVDWEKGREIVLEAFGGFSPSMRERADEFFREGWIDAEARKGKTGGAFCMYVTPDKHPYILMSYMNKMDDVMTLAHELGHGVHASLSRQQSYLNFHGTLPLAELASTFGEMLVFEKVTANATLEDKLALYAEKIEGIFATVFRQAAMFQFEQACHEKRREEGELTAEQFGDLWQERLQEMFGNSIKLGEQHRDWWSYIGHFFFAPFYVYAYSFGELLALSLYQMAKAGGSEFEQKYIKLLELGGSKTPRELMATVGVDLGSEAFWLGGFGAMESLVSTFESLWAQRKATL